MRVSSGDYFSKTNGPRSGATKYGILNESKIYFLKKKIKTYLFQNNVNAACAG